MRPIVITTVQTDSDGIAVRLNYRQKNFKVGFGTEIVSGTATYSIQHTFDDPADYATTALWATNGTWFDNADSGVVGVTAIGDGNYDFPVQGSKVIITSGTGVIKVTYLQG